MDNSFFCIRSYNFIPGSDFPCLECLKFGAERANFHECLPFPVKYNLQKNIDYLNCFKSKSKKVSFLAQTTNQKLLLERWFGDVKCSIVGLKTSDMYTNESMIVPPLIIRDRFDFVFHGASIEVKGILFVLGLSRLLPDFTFLIPDELRHCENVKYPYEQYPNVTFQPMTWETGLGYYVEKALIVLHLSLWSTPIEGALIKSLKYNGLVAGFSVPYSFIEELPQDVVIRLDNTSIAKSAKILEEISKNKEKQQIIRYKANEWINHFLEERNIIIHTFNSIVNEH
jgi:hypothetical protein